MPEDRPIVKALSEIRKAVASVKKAGRNDHHKYSYAAAGDVMHVFKDALAENGVDITPHEISREFVHEGRVLVMSFEFHTVHESGDKLDPPPVFSGMCACVTKSGAFDDKAANKCLVGAQKYFLLQKFQIPTGDYDDADGEAGVHPDTPATVPDEFYRCQDMLMSAAGVASVVEAQNLIASDAAQSMDMLKEQVKALPKLPDYRALNKPLKEEIAALVAELKSALTREKEAA